jgi:hypothetical protein
MTKIVMAESSDQIERGRGTLGVSMDPGDISALIDEAVAGNTAAEFILFRAYKAAGNIDRIGYWLAKAADHGFDRAVECRIGSEPGNNKDCR